MPRDTREDRRVPLRELEIARVFDAPQTRVYAAFTEAPRLKAWFGPRDFTIPVCESDPQSGGQLRLEMRAADGTIYPLTGTYGKTDPPAFFELFSQAIGPNGAAALAIRTTYAFAESAGKTELTMRITATVLTPIGEQYVRGMDEGWTQSLAKLEAYLRTAS
jgi:uncharacterized protein YndB with AHSA1/START domain